MKKFLSLIFLSLPLLASAWQCCPCYEEPACPEVYFPQDKCAIKANAEFLYWTAQAGNLNYAIKQNYPAWQNADSYAQGKYKRGKFDWDPGFRVSIGYLYGPNFWEAIVQYTWMSISGKDVTHAPTAANVYLNGTWPHLFDAPLSIAKSELNLDLNLADVLAARVFVPNPHFRLKLIGGFTGGRINEEWKIYYKGPNAQESSLRHKWRYTGIGYRTGVDMDWFWKADCYLSGKVTLAGLLGKYVYYAYQTTNSTDGGQEPLIAGRDSKYDDYRFAFNLQMLLGPSWQKTFCSSRWEVFIGYELNNWYNLQEIYQSGKNEATLPKIAYIQSSALTFHGLALRMSVDF